MAAKSKDVDKYIGKFDGETKKILQKLRRIILNTFPDTKEETKFGVPWYLGRFYLVGLKDHVNMGFAFSGRIRNHAKELEGKGDYMRHIKFFKVKDIDEKKIVKLMRQTDQSYECIHKKKKK